MAFGFAVSLRNNRLDEITALLDAGAGAGLMRLYVGPQPATGGAATTLLAELIMGDPSFVAAVAALLTANPITPDPSANASGTSVWGRLVDSVGTFVADFTVGTSGTDLILDTNVITIGIKVSVISFTMTGGNP